MNKLKLSGAKDFTPITQIGLDSRFNLGSVWTQICARLPCFQLGTLLRNMLCALELRQELQIRNKGFRGDFKDQEMRHGS